MARIWCAENNPSISASSSTPFQSIPLQTCSHIRLSVQTSVHPLMRQAVLTCHENTCIQGKMRNNSTNTRRNPCKGGRVSNPYEHWVSEHLQTRERRSVVAGFCPTSPNLPPSSLFPLLVKGIARTHTMGKKSSFPVPPLTKSAPDTLHR